jgi:MoxR-like ATPase
MSKAKIMLEQYIGEKVKLIHWHRKNIEKLGEKYTKEEKEADIGYDEIATGYRDIITQLNKDIEEAKEEYRVKGTFKYSFDDVRLSPHKGSIGKDMSEKETYVDLSTGRYSEKEEASPREVDGYTVRREFRELFEDDYRDIRFDLEHDDWMKYAEVVNEMGYGIPDATEPELVIDDTIIGKLKASVDVPDEFKFSDNNTFYTMLRNIFRGKNILVTGPSGCGKSSLGKILAGITNKPFYSFNFGDTMNPSAKILGDTKFSKEEGTWFKPSRFVSAITDNSGAFIMLDEITRDRTGDLANILMPVLDGQKSLALDESEDADVVSLNDGAFFYATANIGREYLGCAHDLDRAWKDRFCGGLYELDYLPQQKEQELLELRVPKIKPLVAKRITEFARKIRGLYSEEELNVAVSTRMCLTTAELVVDGMKLVDALKHTVLPFYPVQAGDDTERVKVLQAIQSMGD